MKDWNKLAFNDKMNIPPNYINNIESWSCSGQDYFILNYFNFKTGGFFVELGCDDGVRKSNTYTLEKNYMWNGICIDASEEMYKKSKISRKCKVVNECINIGNEKITYLDVNGGASGIIGYDNNINDDKEIIDRVNRKYPQESKLIEKKTKSLAEVLEENNSPKIIDYISLDTEGNEYDILKYFPFEKYKVIAFSIERPNDKLNKLLLDNNYKIVNKKFGQDKIFILSNPM